MYQNEIKMDQNLSDQMQRLIRFAQRSFATSKMQTPPVFIKELAWRIEYDEGSDHPWSPVREPLGDEVRVSCLPVAVSPTVPTACSSSSISTLIRMYCHP